MTWAFAVALHTLWCEARGESFEGRQAVAHVLWNRFRDGRWGKTLAAVCLYPLQFSCWNTRDPNRMLAAALPDNDPVLLQLSAILTAAETEDDPTHGATFYYAGSIAEPGWAKNMLFLGQFGNQFFYRER